MKRNLPLLLFLFIALSNTNGQGLCDTAYWHHTYLNQRLKIFDSCVTFKGTIKVLLPPLLTGDGDYHIYVQPDTAYTWMLNYKRYMPPYWSTCLGSDSSGSLICPTCLNVEEICKGTITDGGNDGIIENAACASFNDTVYLPNVGEHVLIKGPFVFDSVHCWNEVHPVSTMAVIGTSGINDINEASLINSLKIFPQPASNDVKFRFDHAPQALTLIKLYTIKGQQLYVYALYQTNMLDVDVSSWPAGDYLYTIILRDQNKLLKSGKFSVVH